MSVLDEEAVRVVAKQTRLPLSHKISTKQSLCCGCPRSAEILKYALDLHTASTRAKPIRELFSAGC